MRRERRSASEPPTSIVVRAPMLTVEPTIPALAADPVAVRIRSGYAKADRAVPNPDTVSPTHHPT